MLRVDGVLVYDDYLAARIDRAELLEPGGEEREIRACAVHAAELIAVPLQSDAHQLTALMWAAGYGKTETVRALLAAGASAELKDDRGKTALEIAREGNFVEAVKQLESPVRP